MTLIAAYKSEGVPILLGDFLITTDGSDVETHRKKIHKISSNFAVGWTGSLFTATRFYRDLYSAFENQIVTKNAVENFLVTYDTEIFISKDLVILGWIAEKKENYCFRWRADYSEMVFYDEQYEGFFHGSGSDFYEKLLKEKGNINYGGQNNDYDKAIGLVLKEVCALTNAEYLSIDKSWRNRYGFAYEILYLRDGQFEYVDDIFYTTIDVLVDSNGDPIYPSVAQFQPESAHLLFKYRSYEEFSLVQIFDPNKNSTDLCFINRVNDRQRDIQKLSEQGIEVLPYESFYKCFTYRIMDIDKRFIDAGSLILHGDSPLIKLLQTDKEIRFLPSREFYEIIKRTTLKAKAKQKS
jgi:hypothetical protein